MKLIANEMFWLVLDLCGVCRALWKAGNLI